MTTGGTGIPRLQELSYLEVVALAVGEGATFEEVRRRMVEHMVSIGDASPGAATPGLYRSALANPKRYVLNVTEALKELMRLGLVAKATLPSSASSAHAYRATTFALTTVGDAWVHELRNDRRQAYDRLCGFLLEHHPQFQGFLRIVGALPTSNSDRFVVPLIRWGDIPVPRTRDSYLQALADWVAVGTAADDLGWHASRDELSTALRAYMDAMTARAQSRDRTDAFPRNQDFVRACEEAIVKFAFGVAGTPIDYISVEILRRWTRTLGLANFSYHTPGPSALRFWATATIERNEQGTLQIKRRVGEAVRQNVAKRLAEAYERVRRSDNAGSVWVPIYRVRAAVCWPLRIADSEFDAALIEILRGDRSGSLGYGVNLDQSSYGSIPPTERPLVVTTNGGTRIYKSLALVPGPLEHK
jgi:hypothetical protein